MKKFILILLCFSSHLMSDLTWTSPQTISNTGVNATYPRLVIDLDNNITALWLEEGVVQTSSLPSGGSWSSITALSTSGATSTTPQIGVDSSGNVIALWIEDTVVKSSLLPFGGSWGSPVTVSSSGASQAKLSVNSAGDAVAVWTRSAYIESSTYTGTWSTVSQISGTSSSNPDVAMNASGAIIAAWSSNSSGIDQVYSATGSVGSSWSSPLNVLSATPALHHNYPKVDIDPNGNATAIWYRFALTGSIYSSIDVLTASLSNGGAAWTAKPFILTTAQGFNMNPDLWSADISFDGYGNSYAFWTTSLDGQSFIIQTAGQRNNGYWIQDSPIVFYNLYGLSADMTVKPSGNTLFGFMNFDGTDIDILFTETDSSSPNPGVFTTFQTTSEGTSNGFPHISATVGSSTLNAAVVWVQYNGTNTIIQVATGYRDLIIPPTDLAVTQNVNNFGIFNEYYNTLTWTASTDPSVTSYNIYRNGAFVNTVDSSTVEFIDDNQVQDGSVTYTIVGVDSEYLQSAPVTVNYP